MDLSLDNTYREFLTTIKQIYRVSQLRAAYAVNYELIPAQPVRQLPWGHIALLIEKFKLPEARGWYAETVGNFL